MSAFVYTKFGSSDALRIQVASKPALRNGEVLMKMLTASVNISDWHLEQGKPFLMHRAGFVLLKRVIKFLELLWPEKLLLETIMEIHKTDVQSMRFA